MGYYVYYISYRNSKYRVYSPPNKNVKQRIVALKYKFAFFRIKSIIFIKFTNATKANDLYCPRDQLRRSMDLRQYYGNPRSHHHRKLSKP